MVLSSPFELLDHLRGIARRHAIIGNVLRDNAACGDNRPIPYRHAFHDADVAPDPSIVPNANSVNSETREVLSSPRGENQPGIPPPLARIRRMGVVVEYVDVVRYEHAVTYEDATPPRPKCGSCRPRNSRRRLRFDPQRAVPPASLGCGCRTRG